MNLKEPIYHALNENSILIKWNSGIEQQMLKYILQLKDEIQLKMDVEVVFTYCELLVIYRFSIENLRQKIAELKEVVESVEAPKTIKANLFHLPVCYDQKYGLDIKFICKKNNISPEDLVNLHCQTVYTIYFIGFLPGFLYLGGLNQRLFTDRKNIPRKTIAKGSVGIAGKQTGIYPQSSPGGWQIIGNCPVHLFDVNRKSPVLFEAGDTIKFYSVSVGEHEEISSQGSKGTFKLKSTAYEY